MSILNACSHWIYKYIIWFTNILNKQSLIYRAQLFSVHGKYHEWLQLRIAIVRIHYENCKKNASQETTLVYVLIDFLYNQDILIHRPIFCICTSERFGVLKLPAGFRAKSIRNVICRSGHLDDRKLRQYHMHRQLYVSKAQIQLSHWKLKGLSLLSEIPVACTNRYTNCPRSLCHHVIVYISILIIYDSNEDSRPSSQRLLVLSVPKKLELGFKDDQFYYRSFRALP